MRVPTFFCVSGGFYEITIDILHMKWYPIHIEHMFRNADVYEFPWEGGK